MNGADAVPAALQRLSDRLAVGRVTLRRDVTDERGRRFPVTEEVLRDGAPSIRDEEYTDIFTSPVARRVAAGEQVVQRDSRSCYVDDAEFQAMLDEYGGMGAQVVTPVLVEGAVAAILSVHHLGNSRDWTPDDLDACRATAIDIVPLL